MNVFTNFIRKLNLRKRNIFIVEDNEVYAKALQAFIQTRFPDIGEIRIFNLGEMCLTELHRKPSIVIMDYFLNSKFEPAYNGLEIIKRIKAQRQRINIILLSAQEKLDVILEATIQYECSYVQKNEEAFNKVEQLINEIFNRKKD